MNDGSSEPRLSAKEAAAVLGLSESKVRHELGRRVLPRQAARRWSLGFNELVYLALLPRLESFSLAPSDGDRNALYTLLSSQAKRSGEWKRQTDRLVAGPERGISIVIETRELMAEVARRLKLYERGLRRVERRPDISGGAPIFRGTRIPLAHVGKLVEKGVPLAELLEDFPALSRDDLEFARVFVRATGGARARTPKPLQFIRANG